MSDRLQFFREQMAAFEGSSDPQKAIEKGYFIQQPRHSLASQIANRIALRPASSHLLIGGIGSGKTTQLMIARDLINEIGDTHAIYIDASLYTDISEIKPGALIAIVGLVLSELTNDLEDTSIAEYHEFIKKQAYGYAEKISIPDLNDTMNKLSILMVNQGDTIKHKGILNKPSKNNQSKDIIKKLYKLYQEKTEKSLIVIIDGLDRLNNLSALFEIVSNDIEKITDIGIGIILVAPLTVAYSEYIISMEQLFDYFYHQPCFDVEKDSEGLNFLEKVLLARTKSDFIQNNALHNLIIYSGGLLRDLINLTQASIEEAYMSDDETINENHVETAVNSFGRAKILGTTDDELKILKSVCEKDNFVPRTQADIQLLASQRILEYQYPERRYIVHPVIKSLLQKSRV